MLQIRNLQRSRIIALAVFMCAVLLITVARNHTISSSSPPPPLTTTLPTSYPTLPPTRKPTMVPTKHPTPQPTKCVDTLRAASDSKTGPATWCAKLTKQGMLDCDNAIFKERCQRSCELCPDQKRPDRNLPTGPVKMLQARPSLIV